MIVKDENLQKIKVKDLFDKYSDRDVYITSPDGMVRLGDFYKKKRKTCKIETTKRSEKVSVDHLLLSDTGWIKAEDSLNVKILTNDGFEEISNIKFFEEEDVFDFEVLHDEHRYFTTSGFCSHNSGKSFLALNIVREAQKMGYYVIYGDSEAAVDEELLVKFNIDPSKVRYQPFKTVLGVRHFVANLCSTLREQKKKNMETPKIMFIVDSLGNLATEKETNDAVSGSDKRDMTKQQNLRSMFRVITTDLAEFKIPTVMTNHTYSCVIKGTLVVTKIGTFPIEQIEKGQEVLTIDGWKPVENLYSYEDVLSTKLQFEDESIHECSSFHMWMAKNDDNTYSWKATEDLIEGDEILQMEQHEIQKLMENQELDMMYKKKWHYDGSEIKSIDFMP